MSKKLETKRLTDFNIFNMDKKGSKVQIPDYDVSQRQINHFGIPCKYCGSNEVILRGWRKNSRKGHVQICFCKRCRRKFTPEPKGHFPAWAITRVLDLAVEGISPQFACQRIMEEARVRNEPLKISRQTIPNIISRLVKIFLDFECNLRHTCRDSEWLIDDTPQIFPRKRDVKGKEGDSRFVWITNILGADTRYWFVANVSPSRSAAASAKATATAVKRAKYAPMSFRCDGYAGHENGIRKIVRHTFVYSKTKKEDFGYINLIESLHSFMRRKAVKKRRFRDVGNLQYLVDLFRIYWNFLHRLDSLGEVTPAAKAGVTPLFGGWADFINYVLRHPK